MWIRIPGPCVFDACRRESGSGSMYQPVKQRTAPFAAGAVCFLFIDLLFRSPEDLFTRHLPARHIHVIIIDHSLTCFFISMSYVGGFIVFSSRPSTLSGVANTILPFALETSKSSIFAYL